MSGKMMQPTLFDDVTERNVIFVIDTSGSMYCRLAIVKEHLKEYLLKMAFRGGCKFNMVEFNTSVMQWSDEMVQCLPETVTVACDWIENLEAKTGTNTESALLAAYNDDECEAVYLVTDGLPDTMPSDILDRVAYVCQGRPCHCIYLTGASVDKEATNFLQDLATDTYGSFMIITVTNHGSIERITPVYKASHGGTGVIRTTSKQIYAGNQKQCSVTSTLEHPPPITTVLTAPNPMGVAYPYGVPIAPPGGATTLISPISTIRGPHPGVVYPHPYAVAPGPRVYADDDGRVLRVPYLNQAWAQWYQPYLWARYRTARSWLNISKDLDGSLSSMHLSPAAGALLIDRPVLARRTSDGLYYKGTVKSQISDDRFLVEFSPCAKGQFSETTYQETFVFDIVQLTDGKRHSIMKGDKVLAPTEGQGDLYAPGTVIDGQECRESTQDFEYKQLIVAFATGKSANITQGEAVWIDQLLYDRTAFELKLPKKTRQQIVDTVANYPEDSFPGYPVSGADRDPGAWEHPRKFHTSGRDATFQPHTGLTMHTEGYEDYRPYVKDLSQMSSTTRERIERRIPGTNLTQTELESKVDAQLQANRFDLEEHDISMSRRMELNEKKRLLQSRGERTDENKEEIDRDISILEAELKYKMKLREKAIDRKRHEIDDDIEIKIRERDQLIEDRRLIFGNSQETRLSRERQRTRSRGSPPPYYRSGSRSRDVSPCRYEERARSRGHSPHSRDTSPSRYHDRSRSRSRDMHRRSRSRSLSTERAPSFGHISPRSPRPRSRSLSLDRSVSFDESLNKHHRYRYYDDAPLSTYDSGFSDGSYTRDSGTNTPIIRNGRQITLKKEKDQRPPWKYWKGESGPDVVDPPFHDPYSQSAVAEPLELRDSKVRNGVLEWGGAHFNKVVPNGRTNYCQRYLSSAPAAMKSVSFQDNSNVHIASGSNLVTHMAKEEKKLQLRQNASQQRLHNPTPSTYYMNGDSVGPSMQDFHRERVAAQMMREKSRPSSSYVRQVAATASSTNGSKPATQKTESNNSYQRQLDATSYKREVEHRNHSAGNPNRDQQRVLAMSARREERDMLQSAKLQQQQNQEQRSIAMKRDRAVSRDTKVTEKLRNEVARERGITAAPIKA